jgi:hypothetical protein
MARERTVAEALDIASGGLRGAVFTQVTSTGIPIQRTLLFTVTSDGIFVDACLRYRLYASLILNEIVAEPYTKNLANIVNRDIILFLGT